MAHEAEILDELRRLRVGVPQLTGVLAASVDGLVLAADTPGVEPEGVAALTAAALGVAVRLAEATGQGELRELLVRGVDGYVATYAAGDAAVLTLLAQDRVNVGRLHLEGRRTSTRIGELVDAAAKERTARKGTATRKPSTPAKPTSPPAPGASDGVPLPTLPPLPARTPSNNARSTEES
ncbi:roadblock/LC7 domain-containing protein [Streptomyces roseirectus]|uniref:Roadblock/LC7 domain-containing protein n=1 Tax=Streptomyces roseirectus TaxID=2768066 RepID=A0A7H0IHM8_9ACTN|nr:roadblock/LC7 domain-containing protein [Streptomyces roseirectus]QNP72294.1 roadblock/LC7 domain-containing protein [Streptomyces roseirectus]